MKFTRNLFLMLVLSVASLAHAGGPYADSNKTPSGVGVRPSSNAAYFRVAEGLAVNCYASVIWISVADTAGLGKAAYASVLSAQMSGKKLAYIDYSQATDGNCWLNQVEIAP